MTGKRVGYIRVSTFDQNPERQLEGIKLDKRFIDRVSGKDINRPELTALINYVREDDHVIVHSMDRLARNVDDLRRIVQQLTGNNIKVEFIKEGLTFTGNNDSPMSQLLLSVMGAFAEFERAIIKERQREGIILAQKRGAYKGRPPSVTAEQVAELKLRCANGEKKTKVAKDFNINRWTLYKYLSK